jgi:hypothetical protein
MFLLHQLRIELAEQLKCMTFCSNQHQYENSLKNKKTKLVTAPAHGQLKRNVAQREVSRIS